MSSVPEGGDRELEDGEAPDDHIRNRVQLENQPATAEKTSVQQKLAALQKLKALKFGTGCSKINPFSVPVAEKKKLSEQESKELLDNLHSRKQNETSDKNFPRRSVSPPPLGETRDQERYGSRDSVQKRLQHHQDLERSNSLDRNGRPESRERHSRERERERHRFEDAEFRFRDRRRESPNFCRKSPPRRSDRRFKPPLEKERLRALAFGFEQLEGQSRDNLEQAFSTLLTLESEIIDLWNQRKERLSLLKETLLRERDELCGLQDRVAGGQKGRVLGDLAVKTYSEDVTDIKPSVSPLITVCSSDVVGSLGGVDTLQPTEPTVSPSGLNPGTVRHIKSEVLEGADDTELKQSTSQPWSQADTSLSLSVPPLRFPSPSQTFSSMERGASGSQVLYTEAGSQHLRLASFLARLPRVTTGDKPSQQQRPEYPPSPSRPPPPLPQGPISYPPPGIRGPAGLPPVSGPGPPRPFRPPSPRGPPTGMPIPPPVMPGFGLRLPKPGLDVPVSVQQMGPRLGPGPAAFGSGSVVLFPPPTAPPRPLLDSEVLMGPEIKRPRMQPPVQGPQFLGGPRNERQKFRTQGPRRSAGGGAGFGEISGFVPDEIEVRREKHSFHRERKTVKRSSKEYPAEVSDMVVVIPDDIELRSSPKRSQSDIFHVIGSSENLSNNCDGKNREEGSEEQNMD